MDLGLSGKRAIVTGGSRGIGRAIVLGLARGGASLAACYNRESEDVERLRGELEEIGGDRYLAQADVADPASADAFVGEAVERFGGLDIVINNAGVVSHKMIEDLDLDEWRRVLDVNLTAIYLITKAALPAMGEGGSIVNITSAVAMRGMPARTHYISSKAGLIGFTRALCKEVGPRGSGSTRSRPGSSRPTRPRASTRRGGRATPGSPPSTGSATPTRSPPSPSLASDLASFVSGVTLNADGGI